MKEEDIKILEEFILNGSLNICCFMPNGIKPSDRIKQSLENLIKGYRELEKENEKLNNANKTYINCIQNITPVLMEDYIEKSKIKEKIKEAEHYIECVDFNEGQAMYKVLQELMEDK